MRSEALPAIADRDPLTVWSTNRTGKIGDWVAVDLGETHRVEEVHLLAGVRIHDIPTSAVVETSLDGRTWTERQRLVGLSWYWWNGHPKHDDNGRSSFYFEPADVRYAGAAPYAVAGALQVNVAIPDDLEGSNAQLILCATIGGQQYCSAGFPLAVQ